MTFTSVVAGLALIAVVEIYLMVRLIRALGALGRIDKRLGRLGEALSLLTETCDTGFTTMGHEITRIGEAAPRAAASHVTARRIRSAARRGQSVEQIAAAEELSEGEVRLRLLLADAKASHMITKEADNGSLRTS